MGWQNVPIEIGIGMTVGIGFGLYVRNYLQNEISCWQDVSKPIKAASAASSASSPSKDQELAVFNAWVDKQRAASPPDVKDTSDFKFITFTEKPKFTSSHKSLMSKILTDELWEKLKDRKSSKGATAGDEECYELFKDLYYPIVKGWHKFDPYTQTHSSDLNPLHLKFTREQQLKFDDYVQSTRIRAARNISGFSLPAGASVEDREGVERVLKQAFSMFDGELRGKYYPLGSLTAQEEDFLQSNGFLFQKPGPAQLLAVAGAARSWPDSRGIFHNDSRTALAWCNEEDHCRIIAMQNGGDVWSVFARFCKISDTIGKASEANGAKLMFNNRLGFLGTCPSNLGTGLRASVMIKLPELNKDPHALEQVCDAFDLQPRGSSGEHSEAVGAKWDISNKQRIGYSEVQLVQKMVDGVTKIIQIEEMLASHPGMTPTQALAAVK